MYMGFILFHIPIINIIIINLISKNLHIMNITLDNSIFYFYEFKRRDICKMDT